MLFRSLRCPQNKARNSNASADNRKTKTSRTCLLGRIKSDEKTILTHTASSLGLPTDEEPSANKSSNRIPFSKSEKTRSARASAACCRPCRPASCFALSRSLPPSTRRIRSEEKIRMKNATAVNNGPTRTARVGGNRAETPVARGRPKREIAAVQVRNGQGETAWDSRSKRTAAAQKTQAAILTARQQLKVTIGALKARAHRFDEGLNSASQLRQLDLGSPA